MSSAKKRCPNRAVRPELVEGLSFHPRRFGQLQDFERLGAYGEKGRHEVTAVSVYAIFADADEARRIGRQVVEERLAACINILAPCHSIYRWQGAVETADEVPAILKTTAAHADTLVARIAALHSYAVPCVTVWPIDKLLVGYAEWVEASTG